MSAVFLAAFIAGLLLGVYAMIRGVERPARGTSEIPLDAFGRALDEARTSLRAPVAASFATVFGATGYLIGRYTSMGVPGRLIIAGIAGGIAVGAAILLIARWIVPAAKEDVVDERFLLQGHLARVSAPIRGGAPADVGEVTYEIGGTRYAAKARSIDDTPVDLGTEVVIERVEDGVIIVEPWVQVEQRI
jgi:membrane protein implicated in regulation of membrane protease activity